MSSSDDPYGPTLLLSPERLQFSQSDLPDTAKEFLILLPLRRVSDAIEALENGETPTYQELTITNRLTGQSLVLTGAQLLQLRSEIEDENEINQNAYEGFSISEAGYDPYWTPEIPPPINDPADTKSDQNRKKLLVAVVGGVLALLAVIITTVLLIVLHHKSNNPPTSPPKATKIVAFFENEMQVYFPDNVSSYSIPIPQRNRSAGAAGIVNNHLVVTGGSCFGPDCVDFALTSTDLLNLDTGQWSVGPPLNTTHTQGGYTVVDGRLYVCSGLEGDTEDFWSTDVCEFLDQDLDKWTLSAPVPRWGRWLLNAVSLSSKLYLLGGYVGVMEATDQFDEFDPQTGNWTSLAPMKRKRAMFGAAVFADSIVACGGWVDMYLIDNSCEMYDRANNSWKFVTPLEQYRINFWIVNFNEDLFALGGAEQKTAEFGNDVGDFSPVDRFDNAQKKWAFVDNLTFPLTCDWSVIVL